ncbi:MAG: homoserine O-acetyltransferase [Vicinamibacteria bacterium]|jgi:homoserine O-acetyltransferase|nr:homoserine O-acetyltransferase [Vicinamibacteria bacterium]
MAATIQPVGGRAKRPVDPARTVGVVDTQFYTFAESDNTRLELDSGARFGPITIAYETYGTLNAARSNAILICHALSGTAHAAGYHTELGQSPGWWEDAIGPGKAFDTNHYFVVCSNMLGGCAGTTGPLSIDPATGRPYGMSFPVVTVGDMVQVQRALIDHLGIDTLLCVAGGSMGGMQALEWALRYPERIRSAGVIAATARLSAQSIAFNAVGRNSILTDTHWNQGDYHDGDLPAAGLAIARMIGHITYLSDESMHAKFGRRLLRDNEFGYDFTRDFQVESYLDHQGNKFVERFDANSYLYITKAMDYFDAALAWGEGDLRRALARVRARMLVLSFTSDWLFPPYQSQEVVDALVANQKDVTYVNIPTSCGHDAFLLEVETETRILNAFLDATFRQIGAGEAAR